MASARRIATGDRMHVHAASHDDRLEEVAFGLLYGHTAAATAGAASGPQRDECHEDGGQPGDERADARDVGADEVGSASGSRHRDRTAPRPGTPAA